MNIWTALRDATTGWVMLLRGEDGWRERFTFTTAGLVTALIIFVLTNFLAVATASASIGMPSVIGVIAAMFVLALPLTSLVVVLIGTRLALGSTTPALDVMVPATYALTAFLLAEGLLAMLVGGPVVMLAWLGLAYMLYRLARAAAGWTVMISAGFAVLTLVLLVAMRLALYMLTSTAGSPI